MEENFKRYIREVLEEYKGNPILDIRGIVRNDFNATDKEVRDGIIFRDTECAINEERGINNDVANSANYILKNIDGWVNKGTPFKRKDGLCGRYSELSLTIFNEVIKLEVIEYILTTEQRKLIVPRSYYDENKNILHIELKRVDGKADYNMLYDVIQHEVNHLYQKIIRGVKPILPKDKDRLYGFVCKNMISNDNQMIARIGICLYISFGFEQESYGNGLYSSLIHNLGKPWNWIYMDSEIYRYISYLKKSIDVFENTENDIEINNALNILRKNKLANISKNKLINLCKKTYHDLVQRAGKVISLVKDQYGLTEEKIRY